MKLNRRDMLRLGAVAVPAVAGGFFPFDTANGDMYSLRVPVFPGKQKEQYFTFPEIAADAPLAFEDAPETIVKDGMIRAGLFKAPPRRMNIHDAKILHSGSGRLLEWVGAGISHPDWYFGFIIVDAQIASLATLYGVNLKKGGGFSHSFFGPRKRTRVTETMWNGSTYIHQPGFCMDVRHRLDRGFHDVWIDIEAKGKNPAVAGRLIWNEDLRKTQPFVMMAPLPKRHFIYNHKDQMPISGKMKIGEQAIEFNPKRDLANMDEVRAFGSVKLKYQWFNGGGFDSQGRVVGLNISASEQRPEGRWSENCLWVGEKLYRLGPARFEIDHHNLDAPWRARSDDGSIDLEFHPEGGKKINVGPLAKYSQKCGRFNGTITDDSGEQHIIADYYGCAENMDILF